MNVGSEPMRMHVILTSHQRGDCVIHLPQDAKAFVVCTSHVFTRYRKILHWMLMHIYAYIDIYIYIYIIMYELATWEIHRHLHKIHQGNHGWKRCQLIGFSFVVDPLII